MGDEQSRPSLRVKPAPGADAITGRQAQLCLVFTRDPAQLGLRVLLGSELWLLGREIEGAAGASIADPRLSGVHARLFPDRRAGGYRLGDAHSKNGTFVNGSRIETVLLADGDVIRAGDSLFVYCEDDAMARIQTRAQQLAHSAEPLLLRGEPGSGRAHLARHIHERSARTGVFEVVDCAERPGQDLARRLCGSVTHDSEPQPGALVAAHGGTLLLRSIDECPLELQAAVVELLTHGTVRAPGAEHERHVDVRLVASAGANLEDACARGRFREDLYERLRPGELSMPPLRARKRELLSLLDELATAAGLTLELNPDIAEALLCWQWPNNVREAVELLERFAAAHPRGVLDGRGLGEVAPELASTVLARQHGQPSALYVPALRLGRAERERIEALLAAHGGELNALAQALAKPTAVVEGWLRALGVPPNKWR